MIQQSGIGVSDPARRAEIIYAQARSQIDVRLWRAALGSGPAPASMTMPKAHATLSMETLVGLVSADASRPREPDVSSPASRAVARHLPRAPSWPTATTPAGLGNNARYSGNIAGAAQRSGIPAAALASIIDAEAAKDRDGSWKTGSRNNRSTATGLGQFLSGTWKTEAQRAGTWLNAKARESGWLGANGRVLPEARAALLALRHDADASINATADYARHSLDKLAEAGVAIGSTIDQIAHAAYLGHNLGLRDAIRFLNGGLDDNRARHLLDAQIGRESAGRRVAQVGGAVAAHRGWLLNFMDRQVNATRFLD